MIVGSPQQEGARVPHGLKSSGRQLESPRQRCLVTVTQASLWVGAYSHCLELREQVTSYLRLKMTVFHLLLVLDLEIKIKVSAEPAPSKGPRENLLDVLSLLGPSGCHAPCCSSLCPAIDFISLPWAQGSPNPAF